MNLFFPSLVAAAGLPVAGPVRFRPGGFRGFGVAR